MISKELIAKAVEKRPWDLGNQTLYDLCEKYPAHTDNDAIIAKIWIIGRAYAAAIERRREKGNFVGDDFYTQHVAPRIHSSDIDEWFTLLKNCKKASSDNLKQMLTVHYELTNLFEEISGLKKRSLASKYLHFHFPDLFFIYDARANDAIRRLSDITSRAGRSNGNVDNEYRKFCEKCLQIRDYVEQSHGVILTPRQLDNLFLDFSVGKAA